MKQLLQQALSLLGKLEIYCFKERKSANTILLWSRQIEKSILTRSIEYDAIIREILSICKQMNTNKELSEKERQELFNTILSWFSLRKDLEFYDVIDACSIPICLSLFNSPINLDSFFKTYIFESIATDNRTPIDFETITYQEQAKNIYNELKHYVDFRKIARITIIKKNNAEVGFWTEMTHKESLINKGITRIVDTLYIFFDIHIAELFMRSTSEFWPPYYLHWSWLSPDSLSPKSDLLRYTCLDLTIDEEEITTLNEHIIIDQIAKSIEEAVKHKKNECAD